MPKWGKFIVAILLSPLCVGAARTLFRVLGLAGDAHTFWIAAIGGAACWLVVFLMLPKPMWVYVFGHELTHALWSWAFGGELKRFNVTAKGGHVVVTKTNFLITLAPYFFPLYAVLVVMLFLLGDMIWDWSRQRMWFHFLLGAAYAFHLTLTWHILQTRQSDITSQGRLFSAVVIFLGNVLILLIAVPLLAGRPTLLFAGALWLRETGDTLLALGRLLHRVV